jgi:hypothetical protein
MKHAHAGNGAEPLRETGRDGIGVPRIAQPKIALEIGDELRAHEAHLGPEMRPALAPLLEPARKVGIEEDDGFGRHRAILGGSQ